MRLTLMAMICLGLLAACGEKKEIKETVFAPAVQARDKARAVEDKLREGAEQTRRTIEASEQDAANKQ